MMMKKIQLTLLLSVFLISGCGKKKKSIESLVSSNSYTEMGQIVSSESESTDRKTQAVVALVKAGKYSTVLQSIQGKPEAEKIIKPAISWSLEQLKGNTTQAVVAKDALTGLVNYTSTAASSAVFNWFATDIEKRKEAGDYKLKNCLEIHWNRADALAKEAVSKAHASWMVKDLKKRGHEGVVLFKRGRLDKPDLKKITKVESIYRNYFEYFKKATSNAIIDALTPVTPSDVLLLQISFLFDYADENQRKKAGDVLLKKMIETRRFTLVSLKAMGDFKPVGATDYLKTLLKPGMQKDVLEAALTALIAITADAKSTEILFDHALPLFKALAGGKAPDHKTMALAITSAKGLEYPRECQLNRSHGTILKAVFNAKLKGDLFELRNSIIKSIYRMIICTEGVDGLDYLIKSTKFPISFEQLKSLVTSFNTLNEKDLNNYLSKSINSKNLLNTVVSVWGISAFSGKESIEIINKYKNDLRQIPQWNQTVGDFTKSLVSTMEKRLALKK
ncbi:hypothetical protein KKF34_14765 [Myxococcota bacterium]|nr:hypothetical protein [Myxococcota bacterium]MBU1498137.1 hypothetical protein [Myxococcota bacterium]